MIPPQWFEHLYDLGMSISPVAQIRDARQRALWDRTAAVAGRLNRAQAELVDIVAEVMEDRHWGDGGFKTPEHYLVVRAGLSHAHAADIVRVARRRSELVDAAAALDAGELSLDQVAVLARHVPASHQASVTGLARNATVPQLRRALARHALPAMSTPGATGEAGEAGEAGGQGVSEEPRAQVQRELDRAKDSAVERRACAAPDLSMSYDADGRFQLRYSAPATVGALVEQAIREAKDALFLRRRGADTQVRSTQDPGSHAAGEPGVGCDRVEDRHAGLPTHADGLEEMATRSLSSVTSSSRSSHYRVYLHLDTDGAWVNGGHAIPLRLLTRFISDGVAQPVWETEGRPVSVGRSMRILPDRARRLIVDRDRGCRFPGCPTAGGFTEIHHLTAWADGGPTDETNMASLCTAHHDGITRGDYSLTGDPTRPDGLVATTRYGLPVRPPLPDELAGPPGDDPDVPADTYQPPSGGPVRWDDVELVSDHELLHGSPPETPAPTTTPRPETRRRTTRPLATRDRAARSSGAGLVIISDALIPWE